LHRRTTKAASGGDVKLAGRESCGRRPLRFGWMDVRYA
jgi:hypothetical protein